MFLCNNIYLAELQYGHASLSCQLSLFFSILIDKKGGTNVGISINLPSLQNLLDINLTNIQDDMSPCSFYKCILNTLCLDETLEEIQRLPSKIFLIKNIRDSTNIVEPGKILVFDVAVNCKEDKLNVSEKVSDSVYYAKSILITPDILQI